MTSTARTPLFDFAADLVRMQEQAEKLELQVGSPEWEDLCLWAHWQEQERALEEQAQRHQEWQEEQE